MSAAENTASLCQAFQDTVARTPDRIALRTLGGTREVTWREYGQQVSGLAATLTDLGVQRGDTVASMMANRIKFHFLDVAIMHLGAVPVSIYNTLRPSEIAYILQNSGARIAFAETIHVAALRPHYVFSPPRLFEKLRAAIEVGFEANTDPDHRAATAEALRVGADKVEREQTGQEVPEDLQRRYEQLQQQVLAPALARVGLHAVDVALTGSAPVPPELVRHFLVLGLPIYEGWGMSEVTAFGVFNRPGDTRVGTVGYPLRGAQIRLADDGELLFRSG